MLQAVREIIESAKRENRKKLLEHESLMLLEAYDIPVAPFTFIRDEGDADKADNVGYPAVVKVVSPDIVHKSDVGGVVLNVKNYREARNAILSIKRNVSERASGAKIAGFLVQKMLPEGGVETIIGGIRDPIFDAVIMFGLGGVFVEVFRDVSFRIAPITLNDAKEMINEIKSARVLQGYRGAQPVDLDGLADSIVKVSKLMWEVREISEMDVNPIIAYPSGAYAVDARFILSFR